MLVTYRVCRCMTERLKVSRGGQGSVRARVSGTVTALTTPVHCCARNKADRGASISFSRLEKCRYAIVDHMMVRMRGSLQMARAEAREYFGQHGLPSSRKGLMQKM
jgi:hypothetical protein